mgnify:CR=1 FL=1
MFGHRLFLPLCLICLITFSTFTDVASCHQPIARKHIVGSTCISPHVPLNSKASSTIADRDRFKKVYGIDEDSSFNPRNIEWTVDLRPNLSIVKHQGRRNTCNAFAATALMEYLVWKDKKLTIDLSEAFTYWAAKKFTLNNPQLQDAYATSDGLAGYLAVEAFEHGTMAEEIWPYEAYNWQQTGFHKCQLTTGKACMECFTGRPPTGAEALDYKLKPIFIKREEMGQFLMEKKKPIVFNVWWYMSCIDHSTGLLHLPQPGDDLQRGGHVILLVGYSAKAKMFIFRNSHGDKWAQSGYGFVSEEYLLKYYEAKEALAASSQYHPNIQEYLRKASMGVSGALIDK